MNVQSAVNLGAALSDLKSMDPALLEDETLAYKRIYRAECLLGELLRCHWGIFNVAASLKEQLTDLSKLAYMTAYLYFGTGAKTKFIPSVLYHDIQASVKNAFICTAKV